MQIKDALRIIDHAIATHNASNAKGKISDSSLGRDLGGSKDTVRNWRRAMTDGTPDSGINARFTPKLLEVADKYGAPVPISARPSPPGFAEAAVREWQPTPDFKIETMISIVAPNARQPSTFKLSVAIPEFFYQVGDILIIDQGRTAESGQIVIANKIDHFTSDAETLIGRLITPYLVPPGIVHTPILIDKSVSIFGPVIASLRSKSLVDGKR